MPFLFLDLLDLVLYGSLIRTTTRDFTDGPVVENLRDMGWIPGLGTKIPPALEQLSLCAVTAEPKGHNTRAQVP